jgi:PST family polysaccharide transporter
LLGSVVALLFSLVAVVLLRPGERTIFLVVALLAAVPFFRVVDPTRYWFQAHLEARYIVLAGLPSVVIVSAMRVVLIWAHGTVVAFAAMVVLDVALTGALLVLLYERTGNRIKNWRVDSEACRRLLTQGWPLLVASIATLAYMKIDQVMLGKLLGDEATGLYSSAVRISEMWYFVPTAIMSSLFPLITAAKQRSDQEYHDKLIISFRLLTSLSVLVATTVSLLAGPAIHLIYGSSYAAASRVLSLHIWSSVPVAIGIAASPWLVTEGYTGVIMQKTLAGALVNVALNLWLIPLIGVTGAAIASISTQMIVNPIWYLVDPRTRPMGLLQLRAILPVLSK